MADTLIMRLSGIADVSVTPLSSVRRYSELEQDPLAAGHVPQPVRLLRGRHGGGLCGRCALRGPGAGSSGEAAGPSSLSTVGRSAVGPFDSSSCAVASRRSRAGASSAEVWVSASTSARTREGSFRSSARDTYPPMDTPPTTAASMPR